MWTDSSKGVYFRQVHAGEGEGAACQQQIRGEEGPALSASHAASAMHAHALTPPKCGINTQQFGTGAQTRGGCLLLPGRMYVPQHTSSTCTSTGTCTCTSTQAVHAHGKTRVPAQTHDQYVHMHKGAARGQSHAPRSLTAPTPRHLTDKQLPGRDAHEGATFALGGVRDAHDQWLGAAQVGAPVLAFHRELDLPPFLVDDHGGAARAPVWRHHKHAVLREGGGAAAEGVCVSAAARKAACCVGGELRR